MRRHLHDDRGSAIVEFALVLPVFFLIVLGSMSAVWLVGERSHVSGIARDLARYASIRHDSRSYPTVDDLVAYAEAKHHVGGDGWDIVLGCGDEQELERDPLLEAPLLEEPALESTDLLTDTELSETTDLLGPYSGPWRNQVICVTVAHQVRDPFGGIASLIGVDDITYTSTAKARTE